MAGKVTIQVALKTCLWRFNPTVFSAERIQSTFNIFMHVSFDQNGAVAVKCPLSKAGDFIELRAERDMLCGLTACSAEGANNGKLKPIDYQIMDV